MLYISLKYFGKVFIVLFVLFFSTTSITFAKNNITVEDLDNLNSRVSYLKKKLEIAELNSKLSELKTEDSEKKQDKNYSSAQKGQKAPVKKVNSYDPEDINKTIDKINLKVNKDRDTDVDISKRANVLSINGVGDQYFAIIKTTQGQAIEVAIGDETKFGKVVDINKNRVLFSKNGKKKALYI